MHINSLKYYEIEYNKYGVVNNMNKNKLIIMDSCIIMACPYI